MAIYGAEAANLALKYLAMGGVYLCGGIAPKILPFLQRGGLVAAFSPKAACARHSNELPFGSRSIRRRH